MPIACLQCSMRALLNGEPAPLFDEPLAEHLRRCHPDPVATNRERAELERHVREMFPEFSRWKEK